MNKPVDGIVLGSQIIAYCITLGTGLFSLFFAVVATIVSTIVGLIIAVPWIIVLGGILLFCL